MEKRNKRWRIVQRNRIYAAKMKLHSAGIWGTYFKDAEGNHIPNPRWIELYKANYDPIWKSVRTPCSCYLCSGEKYNRRLAKKEAQKEIEFSIFTNMSHS